MAKTVRADQLLVDRGLAESRARAQALILAGLVYAGDLKLAKAGQPLRPDSVLDVRGRLLIGFDKHRLEALLGDAT